MTDTKDELNDQSKHRLLRYGDPEIKALEAQGWIESGLWDGRDEKTGYAMGGPIMSAPGIDEETA